MKSTIVSLMMAAALFASCKKSSVAPVVDGTINVIAESSVPAAVVTSLNTSFPGSTEREWRDKGNSFEVEFNFENERHESEFDDSGNQSSHHIECLDGAVPAVVLSAFRAGYPNDNVYEWKFTSDSTWKAHFMRGMVKWEVTLSVSGTIIKVEHD